MPEPPAAPTERSSAPLPAPYRSPWLLLVEALRAVGADLRLRAAGLWRRNRSGELPLPSFWPRALAGWFWPLLLALLLMGALLLVFAAPFSPPPEVPEQLAEPAQPVAPAFEQPPDEAPDLDPAPIEELLPSEPEAVPLPAAPDSTAAEEPMAPEADPLQQLLSRPEADGLLRGAYAGADATTLVLEVASAFAALPVDGQQRRAEQWQLWGYELGYDHVELRDARAGLLARDALVGQGMIVLSEPNRP